MKYKKYKLLLVLSVPALLCSVGNAEWVLMNLKQKEDTISAKPSVPVCYIDGTPDVKYTTIEKALEVANKEATDENKKTVVVIPNTSKDFITPSYVISRSCTIGKNVTLVIPYDTSVLDATDDKNNYATNGGKVLPDSKSNYSKFMKSNIGLNSKMTIEGNLLILGKLSSNDQRPTGHTSAQYAQLSLFDNAEIDCTGTGSIECYGFIKEWYQNNKGNEKKSLNDSNGSKILFQDNSSLEMPGVIYDFYGGRFSSGATSENCFPFTSFDFPNIQSTRQFSYGAKISACSQVYANDKANPFERNVIGPNDDYLFVRKEGSQFTFKYNSLSSKFSSLYGTDADFSKWSTRSFSVDAGSREVNAISLNGISSSSYFLPINFKYRINVRNGATLNFKNKVKFLSGSELKVEKGATVNFTSQVLFHQKYNLIGEEHFTDDTATAKNTTSANYPFPSDENIKQNRGTDDASALLVNNGTISIASSFGGYIKAGSAGAKVVISDGFVDNSNDNSAVFDGVKGHNYVSYKNVKGYAVGNIGDPSSYVKFVNGNYTSNGSFWVGKAGDTLTEETREEKGELQYYKSCILPDTLVLMADHSYRKAEKIKPGDLVLGFNHERGTIEAMPILFNFIYEEKLVTLSELDFEGEKTTISGDHGFFDLDLDRYVYLNDENADNYIGHRFASWNGIGITAKKLTGYSLRKEITKLYCPVTVFHLDYFVGTLLSMPGGIEGCFNIFEYGKSRKYDEEKKNADIAKYGLLSYSEVREYIPEIIFDSLPRKYRKVAIGKGMLTKETLEYYRIHFYSLRKK